MHFGHVAPATLLQDGQALVADAQGELYNPSTGQWTLTANMYFSGHTGVSTALLTNGNVLIYGNHLPSYSSEFYNPSTNTWYRTFGQNYGNISSGPLALLGSGKVLLAGGKPKYGSATWASLLYDPSTNYWTLTGSLHQPRRAHTLTQLLNGQVLAAGGSFTAVLVSAELYTP